MRELWRKNLVQIQRVTALERDAARLEGERGQLIASIAQAKGKITETELQILQIDQDLRTEVGKELREIQGKIAELVERKVAAEDQLKRIDIRAPQDGIVHQSTVHTVGGVITAGEPIMLIVPEADALTVEAKLAPQDIDQVRVGQSAVLRFSAFNQRTTPELNGVVSRVSADLTTDQRTGATYYTVRIAIFDERDRAARRLAARPRHAGRGLHPDRRAHRAVLPDEALHRSGGALLQGTLARTTRRGARLRSRHHSAQIRFQEWMGDSWCVPSRPCARRSSATLSVQEIARRAGISMSYAHRLLAGEVRRPSYDTVMRLERLQRTFATGPAGVVKKG